MNYPFIPKSTAHLESGHFWPIPLSNGKYGCGVVLAKLQANGKTERKVFYAALLNWCGEEKPSAELIEGCTFLKKGALHVKAISCSGSKIIGKASLKKLPPNPSDYTDEITAMGFSVLSVVAEKHFVE